jgi:hypothetical protein
MKNIFNVFVLAALALGLHGCAAKAPQKSQLEIREFQTRVYPIADTKRAMKAVLNVLQDEGYIVKEANTELGFLTATKEMDVESGGAAFFGTMFGGRDARWDKNSIIEVTANVTERAKEMRVRVNFNKKVMNNRGEVSNVEQIGDQKFYQEFFVKVDKGVFIENEKL